MMVAARIPAVALHTTLDRPMLVAAAGAVRPLEPILLVPLGRLNMNVPRLVKGLSVISTNNSLGRFVEV
jgi:hypothetical protein